MCLKGRRKDIARLQIIVVNENLSILVNMHECQRGREKTKEHLIRERFLFFAGNAGESDKT